MTVILQHIRSHKLAYALSFVIFYQILCALQGFDLSDEGWGMYFYQQIFKNPECVIAQMPYWVTGVIGGVWNMLFPAGGFLGMRLFGIALVTLTFWLSYSFLKKSLNSGWLLIGLIAQVIIVAGDPKPYGYNSLTAFVVLLSVFAFWRGLKNNKRIWLFVGGVLLGVNVFVRIPNIAILPIGLLIPIYLYWQNGKVRLFDSRIWVAIAGIVVGILGTVLAMVHWGYWGFFMESMTGVANSATDETNTHQFGRLVVCYLKNYWGIISLGSILTALGYIYIRIRSKFTNKIYIRILNILLIILLFVVSLCCSEPMRSNDMYFVQFFSYIGSLLILFSGKRNGDMRLRYAALASLFMIVCIPLGSDQGIITMWTSAWLALPLSVAYLYRLFSKEVLWTDRLGKILPNWRYVTDYLAVILFTFILSGIYKNDNSAYYDIGSRFEKTHAIHNQYCRFIYTNSYRAGLVNELLPVLNQYVKADDYLMVYNFMPGLNYMTDTRSYVSNSWLWGLSGMELEQQFEIARQKNRPLPVVVRHHFVAVNRWRDYDPHYTEVDRNPVNVFSRPDQTKAINDFLNDNHYKRVWTNQNFEILLPEQ